MIFLFFFLDSLNMRKEIIPAYSISSFRLFAGFSTGMEFAGEERYRYGSMVSMNYIFKKRNKTGGITIAPRTDWTVYGRRGSFKRALAGRCICSCGILRKKGNVPEQISFLGKALLR
mgnify:CR=1 FL=1